MRIGKAYELASDIHNSVWLRNGLFTEEEIEQSRLSTSRGHISKTEQVYMRGYSRNPKLPGYETLALGKNGFYYFTQTDGTVEYCGEFPLARITITPGCDNRKLEVLERSLMVAEFDRLLIMLMDRLADIEVDLLKT